MIKTATYVTTGKKVLVCLVITAVLILELINTAIEKIVNMVSPEICDSARIAKFVSAGAVLIVAIASIFNGAFLFLPTIL